MWKLKYDTNELIHKTGSRLIDTESRLVVAKGKKGVGEGRVGVWGEQTQTIIYRMNKQQGPTL